MVRDNNIIDHTYDDNTVIQTVEPYSDTDSNYHSDEVQI